MKIAESLEAVHTHTHTHTYTYTNALQKVYAYLLYPQCNGENRIFGGAMFS